METLIGAFRAWDEAQLDPLERALRNEQRYYLINRFLGNAWSVVGGSCSHVCGLSLANAASFLNNTDARLHVLAHMLPHEREHLNERATSTDANEGHFACMTGPGGQKPLVAVLQGRESRVSFLAAKRQQPEEVRGWSYRRPRSRGGYAMRATTHVRVGNGRRQSKWNNGAKLADPGLSVKREGAIQKRAARKAEGKRVSVRVAVHNKAKLMNQGSG